MKTAILFTLIAIVYGLIVCKYEAQSKIWLKVRQAKIHPNNAEIAEKKIHWIFIILFTLTMLSFMLVAEFMPE
jgi:hypothetical protein